MAGQGAASDDDARTKKFPAAAPPGYRGETRMYIASADEPPDLIREDGPSSRSPGRYGGGGSEIDEEDEEEMVSLEQQRIMRSRQQQVNNNNISTQNQNYNGPSRRTPGASAMHGSAAVATSQPNVAAADRTPVMRRTPGAASMHRSAMNNNGTTGIMNTSKAGSGNGGSAGEQTAVAATAATSSASQQQGTRSTPPVLRYGLTLATPVVVRKQGNVVDPQQQQQPGGGSVNIPPSAVKAAAAAGRGFPPPTPSSVGRQSGGPPRAPSRPPLYTPAGIALAKNPHINAPAGGRDAFSPATVRLTETLDKLMDEEDEEEEVEEEKEEGKGCDDSGRGNGVGGGGGTEDALAAAINESPRRGPGTGDNNHINDLSVSSSSADPSPNRKPRGLGLDGMAMEDWSAVYTFENDVARRLQEDTTLVGELNKVTAGKPTDGGTSGGFGAGSYNGGGAPGFTGRNSPPGFAGGMQQQQQLQQQKQRQLPRSGSDGEGNSGYNEPDGPVSFGAFAPPTNKQSALHTPKPKKAGNQQEQQQHHQQQGNQEQQAYNQSQNPRMSESPDAEMMQLQQQFHQMGQAEQQPPRWMGTQSPHMFMESPVPPAIFGHPGHNPQAFHGGGGGGDPYGLSFINDPHHAVMSPMNVPPLPSGIMSPVPMSPVVMSPVTVPMAQMGPSPLTVPGFNGSILPGTMAPPGQQHNFGLPPMAGPGLWSADPSQQQQGFRGGWGGVPGGGGILPPPLNTAMAPSPVPPHAMTPVPPHAMSPVPPAWMDPSLSAQAGVFHPQMHPGPDYRPSQQQQPQNPMQQQASRKQSQRQQQLQQHEQQPQASTKKTKGPGAGKRGGIMAPGIENLVPSSSNSHSSDDINPADVSSKLQDEARRNQKTKGQKKSKKGPEDAPESPKKGKKQQQQQSNSTSQSQKGSTSDPGELKKAELNENPATKLAFKEFYRKFHALERTSLSDAQQFATSVLEGAAEGTPLPGSVHWRVYLELADLAKRSNQSDAARELYGRVCELQPYTPQGWLEYSKLEEECGNLPRCSQLLYQGLGYCEYNESLMTRAIKHEEKTGNLDGARSLLARLKHAPGIEKVWRTVLEGALFEARAGNTTMARRLFKYLMHHVPWYGPLYLEAYKLERDSDQPADALAIVERGLGEIPRYGPLWFGAFRLCEGLDLDEGSFDLPRTMEMVERATSSISRELLWKVHLEAAQAYERAAVMFVQANPDQSLDDNLGLSRTRFARAALACPPNLCWKVWLAGGKMELTAGRFDVARTLFHRASDVVPEKGRSAVFLEFARLEEFVGNMKLARAILYKARYDGSSDWKIWLESVNLEIRCKMPNRAARVACEALKIHTGTGRLWAALVQLRHREGEDAQLRALKQSLRAVPKSGEVWGEGARIHLNPFSPTFDLERADQHLIFATKFTPQYGDSFLETLRLELMTKWIVPGVQSFIDNMEMRLESPDVVDQHDVYSVVGEYARVAAKALIKDLLVVEDVRKIDTTSLELRCSNADPNYGKLWFRCRTKPADTARNVLVRAKFMIAEDLAKYAHIYVTALLRRKGAAFLLKKECLSNGDASIIKRSVEWDSLLDDRVRNGPTIGDLLTEEDGMALLEGAISGADFTTGLFESNKPEVLESLSLTERRKLLFGSDLLLSWKSP